MPTRSIFTAFILSLTTAQAWAQTVPAAPNPTPDPAWRPAAYGATNGAVPAAATVPAFTAPAVPNTATGVNPFLAPPPAVSRRART